MPESKNAEATITFKVKKPGGVLSTPRWRKAEAENASCLKCGQVMVVLVGDNMYAYCPRCQCYYVAE